LPARTSSSERLGPWVWLPLAGLALIVLAILNLPGSDCESGGHDSTGLAEVLLLSVTLAASLGCVAAALFRIVLLARAGRDLGRQLGITVVALAAGLLLVVVLEQARTLVDFIGWLTVVGTVATALLLLTLIVAWLAKRRTNDVGMLLPLYLLGAGLAVYPLFSWFALAVNSGGLC
jgi:hypothetical protein